MNRYLRVIKVDNGDVIKPHVMEYLNYMVRGAKNGVLILNESYSLLFINPCYLNEIQFS